MTPLSPCSFSSPPSGRGFFFCMIRVSFAWRPISAAFALPFPLAGPGVQAGKNPAALAVETQGKKTVAIISLANRQYRYAANSTCAKLTCPPLLSEVKDRSNCTCAGRRCQQKSLAGEGARISTQPNTGSSIFHSFLFKCNIDGPPKGGVNVFSPLPP